MYKDPILKAPSKGGVERQLASFSIAAAMAAKDEQVA